MSISPVSPTAQANDFNSCGSSNSSATGSATDYTSMFMQLLATELQSQDPTQTMDPTTMVTQMVQINQLNDVAGIYSILQGGSASPTTSGATASAPTSNASAAPATSHAANSIVGGN